jgi:hypothetical protein
MKVLLKTQEAVSLQNELRGAEGVFKVVRGQVRDYLVSLLNNEIQPGLRINVTVISARMVW